MAVHKKTKQVFLFEIVAVMFKLSDVIVIIVAVTTSVDVESNDYKHILSGIKLMLSHYGLKVL